MESLWICAERFLSLCSRGAWEGFLAVLMGVLMVRARRGLKKRGLEVPLICLSGKKGV